MKVITSEKKYLVNGFTLIELILVIVILSILSTFALPRFFDLTNASKRAKVEAASGSIKSAASIVYLACVSAQDCNNLSGPAPGNGLSNSIEVEGQQITLAFGYPRHTNAGIIRASGIDPDDYTINTSGLGVRVRAIDASTPSQCQVEYIQATVLNTKPTIIIDVSDC